MRQQHLAFGCLAVALAIAFGTRPVAQQIVPGNNVNMVSGTSFPTGDPFLQRQNEPSVAVSTRNPLHILAGANDYRTVDLPGPLDPLRGEKMNADAWLGLFKSLDGGRTWQSTLLPGYPQDTSPEGIASPIKGRQAGTDAVVKAGTNGLFYYTGLAFDRGPAAPSTIFVSRLMDLNNRENGDPISYIDTRVVDSDGGVRFLDKTAMAVDVPRNSATCTIEVPQPDGRPVSQTIPAGNVYVAYSAFTGSGSTLQSRIMFSRSTDCGATWSTPKSISIGSILVQNAQIALNPTNGAVWVSWRRFKSGSLQNDAVYVTRSIDGGVTFSTPVRVASVLPLDQATTETSFRSNAFQTMTVDASGRVYVAWPQRGYAQILSDPITGDARIVVSTSTTGTSWTAPTPISTEGLGHQIMPTISFHAGKLRLIYYDLREDVSQVFQQFIDELPILTAPDPKPPRHTIDVFVAQALPAAQPVFTATRLSDYAFGTIDGSDQVQRLQYNPPNLPLFRQGTAPFIGDYIDLAPSPAFVQNASGQWVFNTAPSSAAVSHGVWTDNRDVRAPLDGDWTNYTPVISDSLGTQSLFDPTQPVPPCSAGQTGMRNQNIYTAKVTEGLFVAAPGNSKPLGTVQRGFVIVVENTSDTPRTYRLEILNQPLGGEASFNQFSSATGSLLTVLDAGVPAFSTIARTVYVTSTDVTAKVSVAVVEIASVGAPGPLPGGQSSTVVLNADPTNPSIQNPSIQNPSIQNPDIQVAETYNPAFTTAFLAPSIQNPSIQNPSIQNSTVLAPSVQNPSVQNDAIANPGIINPSIQNPSIQNPSVQNPSIQNPSIQNEDIVNGSIQDTTWVLRNDGNTTASYAVKLVMNGTLPEGFKSQLVLHKNYTTPTAQNCQLAIQPHTVVLANITDPTFTQITDVTNPSIQNPSVQNATLSLAPGETANVTLRIVDPNRYDGVEFDAGAAITPAAVAHSVNSEDAAQGVTTPPVAVPLTITTASTLSGSPGTPYSQSLQTFASTGTTTWTVTSGSLPPGIVLDPVTGQLSGTPTTPGNYVFTVQALDADGNIDTQTLAIKIDPPVPPGFSRVWNGADTNWSNPKNWSPAGVPTQTDSVYISAAISVIPTLTEDVTIQDLVVESGATVDTNGFTLTILGNGDAGNTIVGTGTVVMDGVGVTAQGTFPSLTISGDVTIVGQLTVIGDLTVMPGARLNLNGQHVNVSGQLVVPEDPVAPDALIVAGGGSLNVGGVDVDGLTLSGVPLTIGGGALTQFDNVRFVNYTSEDVHLTVNNTGGSTPFAMSGLSFFVVPTTGKYITATDPAADGQSLVLNVSASLPADGSSASTTDGGAVVNWLFDPASASIAIAQFATPSPAIVGMPVTYTVLVKNGGPAAATNVVFTDTLPAGATLVSVSPEGSCGVDGNLVTCSLGTIAAGDTVVVQIVVNPTVTGTLENSVGVTAAEADGATSDNSQLLATQVVAPSSAANLIVQKDPVADASVGVEFTYNVTVMNQGPATATNVIVTDSIPASLIVKSATSSTGTCNIAGQVVTCVFNSLAMGETATIQITVEPTASGTVVSSVTVTAANADPAPQDNFDTEITLVGVASGCGVPSLSAPAEYFTFAGATNLVRLVDMNHDSLPDIVTTHQTGGGAVTVVLNNGNGTYGAPLVTAVPPSTFSAAVADFNGDSHPDVLVGVGGAQQTLRLLTNDGAGNLTLTGTSLAVSSGFIVEAGDLDNDGDQDVLSGDATGLVLFRNNGAGVFDPPVSLFANAGTSIATGDFNADGRLDIAVAHPATGFSVLLADGLGGYAAPVSYASAATVSVRNAGDLNSDGHLDLLLRSGNSLVGAGQLAVRFGDGQGAFAAEVSISTPGTISSLVTADVNGDGKRDIVSSHAAAEAIAVQIGNGNGTFAPAVFFATPAFTQPAVADVNGDSRPDVAVADVGGTVRVLLNQCGQPAKDLAVGIQESSDPVAEGQTFTYTVTVTNNSDSPATGVQLTGILASSPNSTLAPNATVATTSSGGGTLTTDGRLYTWSGATVPANGSITFGFEVTPHTGMTLSFRVGVTSDFADPTPANNSAFETTTVTATGGQLKVTNTNDSGPGSLRQAILHSNADTGDVDQIVFDIPGAGPYTIVPLTALPTVTQPVVIDGTTQPGYDGTPVIELNGNGLASNGLGVTGGSSTIRGLAINRFNGTGIVLTTNGGNLVAGNFIGTDVTGTVARANTAAGISISSGNNIIGGTAPGTGNLVSGNGNTGILMTSVTSTNNQVVGNKVGTDITGTAAIPNGNAGVQVLSGSGNIIGGTTPAHRNLISGGAINGVSLRSGATNNRVEGNYIGTNAAGTAALGNVGAGVAIGESSNNTIGGTAPGAGNLISGNLQHGITIFIQAAPNVASGNVIQGNLIGTNAAGTAAIPNAPIGISISGGSTNTIVGGTSAGARNVISGNNLGISIIGSTTTGTVVAGNFIGTDITGTADLGNVLEGIFINSAPGTVVGGTVAGARNVISGNNTGGIRVFGASATGVLIQGNYIGTDAAGAVAISNTSAGITLQSGANGNTIGGGASARNVISGNTGDGIFITGTTTTANTVKGNYIGTNAAGTGAIANQSHGVSLSDAPGNTIGGTAAGDGNTISGNVRNGIGIFNALSSGNVIQGNRIGTNAAGTEALPNGIDGIGLVNAVNTIVGGPAAAARNVVSGNARIGVGIFEASATGNVVLGNFIGTDAAGTTAVPNTTHGVFIGNNSPGGNSIGGVNAGEGNLIAFNLGDGVRVSDGNRNAIRGNAIRANGTLGIDLQSNGVTANDPLDADAGANNLQNFPVLTSVVANGATTTVQGTFHSTPNATFRLEFFSSAACDASGFGEGEAFVGSTNVTTNGSGDASFSAVVNSAAVVTATATDPDGNTSEFSACLASAVASADLSIAKVDSADPVTVGTPFTYTLTIANNGPTAAINVVVTDDVPLGLSITNATSSQGTCTVDGQAVGCTLGSISASQQATVTITVVGASAGLVTNTATVASATADPDAANNSSTQTTMIALAAGCSVPTFLFVGDVTPFPGAAVTALRRGDLNEDGVQDIVTSHQGIPGAVARILMTADGDDNGTAVVQLNQPAFDFALADFTGDGHLDVIVGVGGSPNTLRLLVGDGLGGLTETGTPIPVGTGFLVVPFDQDGDGDMDLLARGTSGDLVLLRNNGSGGMDAPVSLLAGVGTTAVTGDFNGDGRPDIAVAHATSGFSVLLANDSLGYDAAVVYPSGATPRLRQVGDLNGDAKIDLVVTTGSGLTATATVIRFGDGAGAFGAEVDPGAGNTANFVVAADINGDGKQDLVVTHAGLNAVAVQLGDGAGGFAAPVYLAAPVFSNPLAADINSDGKLDIGIGDGLGTLRAFFNTCGQPPVDLGLTLTESADPVNEGDEIVYTLQLRNHGTSTATDVRVNSVFTTSAGLNVLPSIVVTSTASADGGFFDLNNTFTWQFPSLAPDAVVTIELRVRMAHGGTLRLASNVTSEGAETDAANNTVFETTTVTAIGADIVVSNTNDGGPGSLRQAIIASNLDSGDVDVIKFAIPGTGPHTIAPLSPLPNLSQPVVIDGTTQQGFSGTPVIELSGAAISASNAGLFVGAGASGTTIKGLVVNRFANGAGIAVGSGVANTVIEGNYIGVDVTGALARPNNTGLGIVGPNTRVGGTTSAARNVISGNTGDGVSVSTAATGTLIQGNRIGTNAAGTAAIGNSSGINTTSSGTIIGGTAAGAGNLVSGNRGRGITLNGSNNSAIGNFIGTNAAGTAAIANGAVTPSAGIGVDSSNHAITGNLISGNNGNGITILSSTATGIVMRGNRIGTDVNGTAAVPNASSGIGISGPGNTVGGTLAADRNVISGNGGAGISIAGVAATGNTIQGNYIGTNAAGTAALGNVNTGISVASGASGTSIGGTAAGAGNVVSGNGSHGVHLNGAGVNNNVMTANLIGTNAAGTGAIPNAAYGVAIFSGAGNTIGGTTAAARNVLSGNQLSGILVSGVSAGGNIIQGNFVGTTISGAAAVPGQGNGIFILGAPNTVVGGSAAGAGNVVSGNTLFGITIVDAATGTLVQGNFIGTDPTGTTAVPNGSNGVDIQSGASGNTIGGTAAGAANVIANNGGRGVNIVGSASTANAVLGNSIFANALLGIDLEPAGVTVNDADDADTGANNRQNFPMLTSAVTAGAATTVGGTLSSTPNTTFRIEFFNNAVCDPSGNGEGQQFIGTTDVTTDGSGNASFSVPLAAATIVTATATDPAGNTSEFSACRTAATASTFTVSNANDSGPGSLREAILAANANAPALDTIVFQIGSGAQTINLNSSLPAITDPVIIDGATQPGYAGAPLIHIDGLNAGAGANGIHLTAGGSTIRGLAITRFGTGGALQDPGGAGIALIGNGLNVIEGNYIGLTPAGAGSGNRADGIWVDGPGNLIGGTTALARNVVSGNGRIGILVFGAAATGNQIKGNFVGTTATGSSALGNFWEGIVIGDAPGNIVGGTEAGARNVISGNPNEAGVLLTLSGSTGNQVVGNYIGVDLTGSFAVPNAMGVRIINGASNNVVGGTTASARNIISGNGDGVLIRATAAPHPMNNLIQGNYIGLNAAGTAAVPNTVNGVEILIENTTTEAGNVVGGTAAGAGNVISGNTINGVFIMGPGNRVQGNLIGTNPAGTAAIGNGVGVQIRGGPTANSSANIIGGTTAAARNVISGNAEGLLILNDGGVAPTSNLVQRNYIGLNAAGTAAIPNGNAAGVVIFTLAGPAPTGNTIGGEANGPNAGTNVISGNSGSGISIQANGNTVRGNVIGLRPDFSAKIANGGAGIQITGSNNTIGGTAGEFTNIITGNTGVGVRVLSGSNNFIQGNIIGDNPVFSGPSLVGNSSHGIQLAGTNNRVGGASTTANIIRGNSGAGVLVSSGTQQRILSNSIFLNTGLGIDLGTTGITANDAGDNDTGANNLQNFPVLTSASVAGTAVTVIGTLNSTANTTFTLQFFSDFACDASGNGEGQHFRGETTVTTDAGGNASINVPISLAGSTMNAGDVVTATATDPAGNTSEFSACVVVTSGNQPPIAEAGPNQVVPVGSTVQLDGSGSSDPEDQPLTYTWIFNTKPVGSTAVLSATNIVNPTFVADLPGTYIAQLVVNDGQVNSPSDIVTITTANQAPIANAGPDQANVAIGATVDLNGSGSSDPDGHPITYAWTFVSRPSGSAAVLFNAATATPSFVVDQLGLYRLQLIVNDGQADSIADTVDITTVNEAPIANAGIDQNVIVGNLVQLSGLLSSDPDENPLTYSWTIVSKPSGSVAALSSMTDANPTFTADLVGLYTVRLTVNDGIVNSAPDDVLINALPNSIFMGLVGTPLVGVGRQATLQIILPSPAPTGGVVVTVTSDNTNIVTVEPPNTLSLEEGEITGQLVLNGISAGTTTVRATAPGYEDGALLLSVTQNVLTVPATLNVPFGQTASFPINIPQPAPEGGVVVLLASSDEEVIEVLTPSVTIPQGALSANGMVRGLGIGTATVIAANAFFSSAMSQVSSTGSLNVVETSVSYTPTFPTSITIQLLSGGSPIAAPAGGVEITLIPANPACAAAASPITIPQGLISTTVQLAYGGTATLPCTTSISASAPSLTGDSVGVTVNADPNLTLNSTNATIGSGLQNGFFSVSLGIANHGGVTVRIASSDPAIALVSPNATTPGTAFIDVPVADLTSFASYYVQGVENATGTVAITASAPGFGNGSAPLHVVQPALRIEGVPLTTTTLSADASFFVRIGTPVAGNSNLSQILAVRAGGSVTVTITNSNAAVAQLTTLGGSGQTRTVTIGANQSNSPTSVAGGGIAFDPIGGGTTTVSASAPGFITTTAGSVQSTVNATGITVNSHGATIGAGLQNGPYSATLGGSNHGGVTVRIRSSNPAVALVSPNATTVGTEFIDVPVANLTTSAFYYLQGVEGATGSVTITASAPGFTDGTGSLTIVQPALRIQGVPTTTTSLSADDPFFVQIGTPVAGNSNLSQILAVRAGGSVTVTITNSNAAVAQLTTLGGSGQTRTVTIGSNQSNSPGSVASGGIAFDPLGNGTTTVSASAPGFITTTAGSATVIVSTPAISVNSNGATIGAGLQNGFYTATLGGSDHGGVTVRIRSSNPAVALVSPNATTIGTEFIDVPVANLSTGATYYLQGVEGATGNVTITASAPGFDNGTGSLEIVQAALRIESLPSSIEATAANAPFFVRVGTPNANGTNLSALLNVRAGSTMTVTVSLNHTSGGTPSQLVTTEGGAQSRTVSIATNQSNSPTTVAGGGVAFDPLSAGTSVVTATAPGVMTTTAGTVTVQITSTLQGSSTSTKGNPKKKGG